MTEIVRNRMADQLRTVLETIELVALVLDEQGRITFCNDYLCQLTGWSRPELLGRDWFETCIPPACRPEIKQIFCRTIAGGDFPAYYENEILTKAGQTRLIGWHNTTFRDEQGQVNGVTSIGQDITKRKKAEKALRQSERILNATGKMGRIGGWEHNLATGQATWTEALYDIVEIPYDLAPPGADEHLRYYPPEDGKILAQAYRQAVENGAPFDLELQGYTAKNKLIWCRVQGEPVYDNGKCVAMRGILQDITERKQAEQELRFRSDLLDAVGEAVIATNLAGEVTFWNRAAEQIYGWPETEVLGRNILEINPAEEMTDQAAEIMQQLSQGRSWEGEFLVKRKNGEEFPALVTDSPYYDDEGSLSGIIGVSRDISVRKRQEQELLETKNLLEKTFASLDEAVLVIDPSDRTIVTCNPAVERIFGYSVNDLIGESTEILHVGPEAHVHFGQVCEPILEEKGIFRTEYRMRRKDGQIIVTDHTVTTITGETGWLSGVSVVRDITDRKQAEESLRQYADRLQTLHDIDRAILAAQSPGEIAEVALSYLRKMIPCQRASVVLYDFQREQARTLAADLQGQSQFPVGYVTSLQTIATLPTLQQGKIVLIDDLAAVPQPDQVHQALLSEGNRTYVNIPLLVQGQLIGSLNLGFTPQRAWLDAYGEVAQEVADQLAIALQQAQLLETERQARHITEILYAAAEALTHTLELDQRLQALLHYLAQLVPYDSACVMLREENHLAVYAARGYEKWTDPTQIRQLTFEIDPYTNPAGWKLVHTQQSVLIPDTRQDPFWRREAGPHVMSWFGVPLVVSGEVIGIYSVDKAEPNFFTDEHLRLAEMLAVQAAVAVQNARFFQKIQQHARELEQWVVELELQKSYRRQAAVEERQRLARELHDAVSQTLFSASVIAETLPRLWERNPEAVRRNLAELHRLNRAALAEMRTLLLELRPAALAETDLAELLKQLTEALAGRSQATVTFLVGHQPSLPTEVKIAFFRIAQEALNNIVKHARPSRIEINLGCPKAIEEGLTLQIVDDGRGFNLNGIPPGHLGLHIMQERADAIGADLTIASRPGQGATIEVIWPGSRGNAI